MKVKEHNPLIISKGYPFSERNQGLYDGDDEKRIKIY